MKASLTIVTLVCASTLVFAESNVTTNSSTGKLSPEARYQRWMQRNGGMFEVPNSAKGKIVFVDAGQQLTAAGFAQVVAALERMDLMFNYEYVTRDRFVGDFAALKSEVGANILVAIHSDDKTPTLLAAPEDGWAVLNVQKLCADMTIESAKTKFASQRINKATIRAFAYACGCGGSHYPDNVLNVASVRDLDFVNLFIPHDAAQNVLKLSIKRGLRPRIKKTYRKGCIEGWAPAPTNDIQKAIWDKVHQLPNKPIKILPETKPVKE